MCNNTISKYKLISERQGGGNAGPLGHDQALALDFIIEEQFKAVNLGKYLRIIKKSERHLAKYEDKKKK